MTPPNDNAARQAAFRARKAAQEKTEVRGIYATDEHHERIKKYAAKLTKKKPTTKEHRDYAKPKI